MKKTAMIVAIGCHEQRPDDGLALPGVHSFAMRLANLAAGGKAVREFGK